jgi:site-specific recombinase XerD
MTHDNGASEGLSPEALVETFRQELLRQARPPHTVRAYVGDVRAFRDYFFREGGTDFPAGVRPADVRDYLSALRVDQAKPATIHRRRSGLVRFFEWCVSTSRCRQSPVLAVGATTLPPIQPPARRALDAKELRRFLRTVRELGSLRDQAACELFAATAIREDELVGIKLEDVVITERRGQVTVRGKGYRLRTLPLHRGAREVLTAWLAMRPALGPYLFPGRYGGRLATSSIRRLVDKYERLSGLVGVAPHALRHSTLTDLVRRKKKDLVLVQVFAGHAKPGTTALYLAPSLEDMEEGAVPSPAKAHAFR